MIGQPNERILLVMNVNQNKLSDWDEIPVSFLLKNQISDKISILSQNLIQVYIVNIWKVIDFKMRRHWENCCTVLYCIACMEPYWINFFSVGDRRWWINKRRLHNDGQRRRHPVSAERLHSVCTTWIPQPRTTKTKTVAIVNIPWNLRRCMVDQSCGELCYSLYKYVESITNNVEWRYCEIEFY